MRFYYQNGMGDTGYFSENNLIRAIYSSWNIESELYLLNKGVKKINWNEKLLDQAKIIFSPMDDNELNSELLEKYGYKMEDGEEYREIINIKTGEIVKYEWSDVIQLVWEYNEERRKLWKLKN